ncbi:hypothetical protein IFM46972_05848 [Aspergillus udagawae]|uniref:Uncharacterized protein n=1 Tax=Aspergillus udagawae TaxID=91492 RepID=A0A8H3NVX9_9EURO|nr:hypothetical protein IFM46972_05848 [Aspergillus udagawae]
MAPWAIRISLGALAQTIVGAWLLTALEQQMSLEAKLAWHLRLRKVLVSRLPASLPLPRHIDNSRLRLIFGVLPNEYEAMLSSRGEIAAYLEFA